MQEALALRPETLLWMFPATAYHIAFGAVKQKYSGTNKTGAPQLIDAKGPNVYARNGSAVAPTENVAQQEQNVKPKSSRGMTADRWEKMPWGVKRSIALAKIIDIIKKMNGGMRQYTT